MTTKNFLGNKAALALIALMLFCMGAWAQSNGTTLAAYKSIDICVVSNTLWRYSGEISVWNEGAADTQGIAISDWIQSKTGKGQFQNRYNVSNFTPSLHEIVAGTTQETADVFAYSIDQPPLAGDIRNVANITILNHSSSLGTPFGPSPKATWTGGAPQPCASGGCTYTQGYWGSKPDVVWPDPYARGDQFFLSGLIWQGILDSSTGGNGYYILAHQYIAAVLNQANGASVPSGVQTVITSATAFFTTSGPDACSANGSCGTQKTWAGILDSYNNGLYPGGPGHCGE